MKTSRMHAVWRPSLRQLDGEDCMLIVKVGSEDIPARPQDIKAVQRELEQCTSEQQICLVTHHAIEFVVIPRSLIRGAKVVATEPSIEAYGVVGTRLPPNRNTDYFGDPSDNVYRSL